MWISSLSKTNFSWLRAELASEHSLHSSRLFIHHIILSYVKSASQTSQLWWLWRTQNFIALRWFSSTLQPSALDTPVSKTSLLLLWSFYGWEKWCSLKSSNQLRARQPEVSWGTKCAFKVLFPVFCKIHIISSFWFVFLWSLDWVLFHYVALAITM